MSHSIYRNRRDIGAILQTDVLRSPSWRRDVPVAGGDVFLDHFTGSSLNSTFWTITRGAARFSVANSYVTLTGTGSGGTCPEAQPTAAVPKMNPGMFIEFKGRISYSTQSGYSWGFSLGTVYCLFNYSWDVGGGYSLLVRGGAWASYANLGNGYYSAEHIYRVEYGTNGDVRFYIDNNLVRTITGISIVNANISAPLYCYENVNSHSIDYIKMGYL